MKAESIETFLVGRSEFLYCRLAARQRQELLHPKSLSPRECFQRPSDLRAYDAYAEFRERFYTIQDDTCPTYLGYPARCVKLSMGQIASCVLGLESGKSVSRLIWTQGKYGLESEGWGYVEIYGTPKMVLCATLNYKDIYARAVLPEWAARVTVSYASPEVTQETVVRLLNAAGVYIGIGDGTPGRGILNFGQFRAVDVETMRRDYTHILAQGRAVQQRAIENPQPYDESTEDILRYVKERTAA